MWTHSGGTGFKWLPADPVRFQLANSDAERKTAAIGNACSNTPVTQFKGGESRIQAPSCLTNSNQQSPKTGTAMLEISPAAGSSSFSVTQSMRGNGLQAVAFGIIVAGGSATVKVDDRIVDAAGNPSKEKFQVSVSNTGGKSFTVATIDATSTATTGQKFMPVDIDGETATFSAQVLSQGGAPVSPSSYKQSWECLRSIPGQTERVRWPATGTSEVGPTGTDARIEMGGFLDCTVTFTPPYLSLVKEVDNADTAAQNKPEDWNLSATGSQTNSFKSAITGHGNGAAAVTKQPVAVGTYALTEDWPVKDGNWGYGYTWEDLVCVAGTSSSAMGGFTRTPAAPVEGEAADPVTGGTVTMAVGNDVTCTFKNTANEPKPVVTKSADPASGGKLNPGQTVTYTLKFDNTIGTAAADINYVDYLADVLDDADFVPNSLVNAGGFTVGGLDATSGGLLAGTDQITIVGSVPARTAHEVSFEVKVKDSNEDDLAHTRMNGVSRGTDKTIPNIVGYQLNNYVMPAPTAENQNVPLPETCEAPAAGEETNCTTHQVRAWTVEKFSDPTDGDSIHGGSKIDYQVKVTNISGDRWEDIVITDDLTEILFASTWDGDAGDKWGIRFYDAVGVEITSYDDAGETKNVNTLCEGGSCVDAAAVPTPVFSCNGAPISSEADLAPCLNTPTPDNPKFTPFNDKAKWTLETKSFTMPKEAKTAVVEYLVEGGFVADPFTPSMRYTHTHPGGATHTVQAPPGATWVNTISAYPATLRDDGQPAEGASFPSNRCGMDMTKTPPEPIHPGWSIDGAGEEDHADCKTFHRLDESFFTIHKNGIQNGVVETDLLGSTFLISDTEDEARLGLPSRWLCHTNNRPVAPVGDPPHARPVPPGSARDLLGTPDFGEYSATHAAIATHNENPANRDKQLPQCGLLFPVTTEPGVGLGGAIDSWYIQDLRGGDWVVNADGTPKAPLEPIDKWRT